MFHAAESQTAGHRRGVTPEGSVCPVKLADAIRYPFGIGQLVGQPQRQPRMGATPHRDEDAAQGLQQQTPVEEPRYVGVRLLQDLFDRVFGQLLGLERTRPAHQQQADVAALGQLFQDALARAAGLTCPGIQRDIAVVAPQRSRLNLVLVQERPLLGRQVTRPLAGCAGCASVCGGRGEAGPVLALRGVTVRTQMVLSRVAWAMMEAIYIRLLAVLGFATARSDDPKDRDRHDAIRTIRTTQRVAASAASTASLDRHRAKGVW